MSSYKDILAGALGSLGSKVKEVAESDAVRSLGSKVRSVAESDTVRSVYEQGSERVKNVAKVAKLTVSTNRDSEELKKVYTEIGKLYFEENRYAPASPFTGLFAQAEALIGLLREKEAELAEMKADYEAARGGIEVEIGDFEDIVNATENEGKGE